MKRLLAAATVILLLSWASVHAQEIKVFGGGGWAKYQEPPNPPIFEVTYTYHAHPGALAGVGLELPFSPILSADIGLQYIRKGTKDNIYYLVQLDARETFNLDVLSLPLCLKVKPFPKLPAYILGGGELSYVLSHNYVLSPVNAAPIRYQALADTRRFDFGLVAGGGAEFAAAKRLAIFVEVRYYLGLVNLARPSATDLGPFYAHLKTRFLALQAGVKYSLPSKKS